MKTLIVFNHPYEGSYCNAILEAVQSGLKKGNHEVDFIHLDKDNFDPVMRNKDLAAFAKARNDAEGAYTMLDPQVMDYGRSRASYFHLSNLVGVNACTNQRLYRQSNIPWNCLQLWEKWQDAILLKKLERIDRCNNNEYPILHL